MKRTSTLEWTVELIQEKEFPGYISIHVDPTRINLYLKDGAQIDNHISIVEISEKELYQIKYMVDQSIALIQQASQPFAYTVTEG